MGNLIAATRGLELPIANGLAAVGFAEIPTDPPRPLTLEEERAQIAAAIAARN